MSNKTQVRVDSEGGCATITFFTEGGLNVLSPDVLNDFGKALRKVREDFSVRTTVIAAEGKVFVAGADIKVMADFGPEEGREYGSHGQAVFNDLAGLPSVTIAAVNGAALGGGLELALACDFRLALKTAKLGLPEVSLGLIPGWNGIPRLTKLVGLSRAKRMFLGGNPVTAEDGAAFGLVDEVAESVEDLQAKVGEFRKLFQRAAPEAVALAKRASRDMDDLLAFADCFSTKDCREGMTAFLEKRPASWME